MNDKNVKTVKMIFIGDQNVGKTVIMNAIVKNKFVGEYVETVGVDFSIKKVTFQKHLFNVQLWDTAGAQRFHYLLPSYFKNVQVLIFVCDLTNPESLKAYQKYQQILKTVCGKQTATVLFANKYDDFDRREISESQCEQFMKEKKFDLLYYTSAKDFQSLNSIIIDILRRKIIKQMKMGPYNYRPQVISDKPVQKIHKKQAVEKRKEGCFEQIMNFLNKKFSPKKQNKKIQKHSQFITQEIEQDIQFQDQKSFTSDTMLLDKLDKLEKLDKSEKSGEHSSETSEINTTDNSIKQMKLSQTTLQFFEKEQIDLQILMIMTRQQIKQLQIPIGDQFRIIQFLNKI